MVDFLTWGLDKDLPHSEEELEIEDIPELPK
jgi:hypothetical protein